jgi:hypothetical protein
MLSVIAVGTIVVVVHITAIAIIPTVASIRFSIMTSIITIMARITVTSLHVMIPIRAVMIIVVVTVMGIHIAMAPAHSAAMAVSQVVTKIHMPHMLIPIATAM